MILRLVDRLAVAWLRRRWDTFTDDETKPPRLIETDKRAVTLVGPMRPPGIRIVFNPEQ